MKACQTSPPSVAKLIATSAAMVAIAAAIAAPALACEQCDRNQHAELRLVGEQPDQHARKPRPAIEQLQRAAEQRGGEKSVLAVADIDEHGGEGGCDQQRLRARQDRADRGEIGRETSGEPQRQAPGIGKRGDEKRDGEEERRIVPAEERHLAPAEGRFLRGVLKCGIVGIGGLALPGQLTRGIDVGEIGADRLAVAVDQAVRNGDPAGERDGRDRKQDQAVAAGARGRQPVAGSNALPDMSHLGAEFG